MWWRTSNCSSLLIYRPRYDERLSWPGWLTYSGRLTHITGTLQLQVERRTAKKRITMHGFLRKTDRHLVTIAGFFKATTMSCQLWCPWWVHNDFTRVGVESFSRLILPPCPQRKNYKTTVCRTVMSLGWNKFYYAIKILFYQNSNSNALYCNFANKKIRAGKIWGQWPDTLPLKSASD